MYKNLTLFINKDKKKETQPDYRVSASRQLQDGSYENASVGSAWLKTLKDGSQVIQISLSKNFTSQDGKFYPGFTLHEDQPEEQPTAPVQSPVAPVQQPAQQPVTTNQPAPVAPVTPAPAPTPQAVPNTTPAIPQAEVITDPPTEPIKTEDIPF